VLSKENKIYHSMEEPPFTCPYCETELVLPDNVWYYQCDHCGKHLDLKSQFAFLRGLDAFKEGQDLIETVSPNKRRLSFTARDQAALRLFMEAYSSLQVAFQADLEESQRSLGVEMMASMANEFMKRNLVSSFEASYWSTLMIEQTAQNEYALLKQKLAELDGPLQFIQQRRWTARQKQLLKSLVELDNKIKTLENQIAFIDIPRGRRKMWKP
jgi:hypothetical protein